MARLPQSINEISLKSMHVEQSERRQWNDYNHNFDIAGLLTCLLMLFSDWSCSLSIFTQTFLAIEF